MANINAESLRVILKLGQDKLILVKNGEKLNALSPPVVLCIKNFFKITENMLRVTSLKRKKVFFVAALLKLHFSSAFAAYLQKIYITELFLGNCF